MAASSPQPEQTASRSWPGLRFGLSGKLLLLTIPLILIAEVLIYVPSIANFRRNWLNDRIAAAQVAALVLEGAPEDGLPEGSENRLLMGVGARAIAATGSRASRGTVRTRARIERALMGKHRDVAGFPLSLRERDRGEGPCF